MWLVDQLIDKFITHKFLDALQAIPVVKKPNQNSQIIQIVANVSGWSSFCLACGHGGHTVHMMEWFKSYEECPAGCGCLCLIDNPMISTNCDWSTAVCLMICLFLSVSLCKWWSICFLIVVIFNCCIVTINESFLETWFLSFL